MESTATFAALSPKFRAILSAGRKDRHLDFKQMNARLGIDHDYFRATWDYLSSEAHTLSDAVRETIGRLSTPGGGAGRRDLILDHAAMFLATSIAQFTGLFPSRGEDMSPTERGLVEELSARVCHRDDGGQAG